MKIRPVSRSFGSSNNRNQEHHRDRLIYLIDELVVMSNIDDSFRVTTSTGVTNMSKCLRLYDKLKDSKDDRSVHISNLLTRLMKMIS